jgi:peroxiredoxin
MPLLNSHAGLLGMPCPDFKLNSVDDKIFALADFHDSRALLITFICNHCPYVRAIEDRLLRLSRAYDQKSLQVVGICSNDSLNYPDDSKESLLARWQLKNYGFPYLLDVDQDVARAFDAVCTPEFYLFDEARHLFYHGRLDDSWHDEKMVKTEDLKDALERLLAGKDAQEKQYPSQGCSIKWRQD